MAAREEHPVSRVVVVVQRGLRAPLTRSLSASLVMDDRQVVPGDERGASGRTAVAEVNVLPVHEVGLVEASDVIPQLLMDCQAGCGQPEHRARLDVWLLS